MSDPRDNPIFRVLTHPYTERVRVWMPYPLVLGIVTTVFAIPGGFIVYAVTGNAESGILIPFVCAAAVMGLSEVIALSGWISGYRPFVARWDSLHADRALALETGVRAAAEKRGFNIVWAKPRVGFVGVCGMEHEDRPAVLAPAQSPLRLSLLISSSRGAGCRVVVKLDVRTLVVWDTGEKARVTALGRDLLGESGDSREPVKT